jgi:hypothetical protein
MIAPYRGKFHVEWYPNVTASAFEVNDLVYLDSNGLVARMTSTTDQSPLGLIQEKIASTDAKYATSAPVPVLIGDNDSEYLCDVGTGTGATGDVGEWVDLDGTYDWSKIDLDASAMDIFFITKFISTTQMVAKMSKNDPRPDSIVD